MDGLCATAPGHGDDFLQVEIGFGRGRRSQVVGLIGATHVQRAAIHIRIDGNRGYTHFAAGANHAYRDFPAVGNENLLEHRSSQQSAREHFGLKEYSHILSTE